MLLFVINRHKITIIVVFHIVTIQTEPQKSASFSLMNNGEEMIIRTCTSSFRLNQDFFISDTNAPKSKCCSQSQNSQ